MICAISRMEQAMRLERIGESSNLEGSNPPSRTMLYSIGVSRHSYNIWMVRAVKVKCPHIRSEGWSLYNNMGGYPVEGSGPDCDVSNSLDNN